MRSVQEEEEQVFRFRDTCCVSREPFRGPFVDEVDGLFQIGLGVQEILHSVHGAVDHNQVDDVVDDEPGVFRMSRVMFTSKARSR